MQKHQLYYCSKLKGGICSRLTYEVHLLRAFKPVPKSDWIFVIIGKNHYDYAAI